MNANLPFNTFAAIVFFSSAAIADVSTPTNLAEESTHQLNVAENIAKRGPLGTVDLVGPYPGPAADVVGNRLQTQRGYQIQVNQPADGC